MKKFVCITLVLLVIISFCSCKKNQSGITIEEFYENAIKQIDKDLLLNIKETSDGFSFQFSRDSSTNDIEYSGEADKERNINLIIVRKPKDMNVEYFNNCTAKDLGNTLKNWGDITFAEWYKLETAIFMMDLTYILNAFSHAETDSEKAEDLGRILAARFSEQEINGWKILLTTNENEGSVTFTARFDN